MKGINDKEREEYTEVAEEAFKELRRVTGDLMNRMRTARGNSSADLIFFAIETALMMTAADLAIFRKDKLDSGVGINAKTFGELAAEHFKSMLELNMKLNPDEIEGITK